MVLYSKKVLIALFIVALISFFVISQKQNTKEVESRYRGLNISCFIYFDKNRNGVYDTFDKPYAGLPVKLNRPDKSTYTAKSNISGFANFRMLLNDSREAIYEVGTHLTNALPPKDWIITSGNGKQELNFSELEGSPAGIILNKTCEPIGVTQKLTLTGEIGFNTSNQKAEYENFNIISPDNKVEKIIADKNNQYSISVYKGEWLIRLNNSEKFSRNIIIHDTPVFNSKLATANIDKAHQNEDIFTLNFDTLTNSDTLYEIPNGYGNLNWVNWIATHQKFYQGYGYINGTVSNEFIAYNSSGHPASVWSTTPFDFIGTYISVAWPKAENAHITVKALRRGEIVYEDKLYASTKGPIYFDANYQNITKIIFSTEKYWQLIIDDFKYRSL